MTPETYLERVRDLLPAVRERAADAEKLRRLPEETFADFQQAGLFRALQPKRYGGYELDPGVELVAAIALGLKRAKQPGLLEIGKGLLGQAAQLFGIGGALAHRREQIAHALKISFGRHRFPIRIPLRHARKSGRPRPALA